jgi:SAM-dependent methyltransferase
MDAPPTIFSPRRRRLARERMRRIQFRADSPRYLLDDIAADMLERLAFLRHVPRAALVVGDVHCQLSQALGAQGVQVTRADPAPTGDEHAVDEERPFEFGEPFDLIASLATLDTVNDLPGALIHLRRALAPGGLLLASFVGAGSLPGLRAAMLAGDADRPAARLHPMVDVRAAASLLQRAGFVDPVADGRTLAVRYSSWERLVGDLRGQGLGNVLARPGPPLGKAALARA